MASLYKRKRSPFWWVKYRDPTGQIIQESTGFLHTNGPGTRAAREVEARKTLAERQSSLHTDLSRFDVWVEKFLTAKYRFNQNSLERYLCCWKTLRLFLSEREVRMPKQLTRDMCFEYLDWRESPNKKRGKYTAGRNTALLELKVLGMIMKEAVHRGYAPANPARELDLKRAPKKIKPEFTDDDYQTISDAIELEPEPNRTAFRNSLLLARYHGVRLNETNVNPMNDVRLWEREGNLRGEITFKQKGGRVRVKPLHPALVQLFVDLRASKATQTYGLPGLRWRWGNRWTKFLLRCGIKVRNPNACFHSTRVTVETRLARAGVDKAIRMEYLTHESQDVNDSYNRFKPDDLRVCHSVAL